MLEWKILNGKPMRPHSIWATPFRDKAELQELLRLCGVMHTNNTPQSYRQPTRKSSKSIGRGGVKSSTDRIHMQQETETAIWGVIN